MDQSAEAVSDEELVRRVLAGDQRAFRAIYDRHAPVVARRLRRVLSQTQDVEDVLQITFVNAHRALKRHRTDRSFSAWLHRIAFNAALTHLRSRRRRWWMRTSSEQEERWESPDSGGKAEAQVRRRELAAMLNRAMQRLSADKQIAFSLHYFEDLGPTEIAELVGASPQTVWARIQSAHKELRRQVERDASAKRRTWR